MLVPRLATDGMQSRLAGATVLRGERHARRVEVALEGGRSEVRVTAPSPAYARHRASSPSSAARRR